jgi:hypothetical protein
VGYTSRSGENTSVTGRLPSLPCDLAIAGTTTIPPKTNEVASGCAKAIKQSSSRGRPAMTIEPPSRDSLRDS